MQQYYGLDMDGMGRDHSVMHYATCAAQLPLGSRTMSALNPDASWGWTERLLSLCRTAEGDSRNAALHDLWEHLLDTAPFAPVCFKSLSVLTTEGVFSGLTPTETNPFFCMGRWSVHLEK